MTKTLYEDDQEFKRTATQLAPAPVETNVTENYIKSMLVDRIIEVSIGKACEPAKERLKKKYSVRKLSALASLLEAWEV